MPLVPSVRELQAFGITFDVIITYVSACHEKSVLQNVDLKTAGVLVAQELRLNRQFGGIQRQIEIAQVQLKMLNTISAQKEKALSVLAGLIAK